MKQMKKTLLVLLIITLVVPLFSVTVQKTDYLKNVRDQIVFDELTLEEKQIMAEQAQIFLKDLYVHRYHKMDYYYNHKDPVTEMEEVVNTIGDMTTAEMEEAIYKIFVAQRDLHLNYIFPNPYANYKEFLPFTFTRTADFINFFQVRINAVQSEIFAEYFPDLRVPEIGDQVLSYNKMPILKAIREQFNTAQGANLFGGFSRALGQMTYVPNHLHMVPEEDEVEIILKSASTGEIYKITVPWLAQWTEESADKSLFYRTGPESKDSKKRKFTKEDFYQSVDLWQESYNEFIKEIGLVPKSVFPSNDSNEPVVKWGIIENQSGKFAYLNIQSFVPETGTENAINEIIRLVNEEFESTDGMIIDVRNNGGGSIIFADKLSQLFMPGEAQVIRARLLNTELNHYIFNESYFQYVAGAGWQDAINAVAGTNEIYSPTVAFTTDEEANDLGQVYYKPVVVLNNARSYSATDLFSCAMQDNEAAVIFGEDPRTGAGGANVITHALFNYYVGAPFETMPLDHRMRVSWRQSVRFGKHEGDLIEDYGCVADLDASLRLSDLYDGGESQLSKLTTNLAIRSFFYQSSVDADDDATLLYMNKDNLKIGITVKNTENINVFINGELYETISASAYFYEEHFDIELPNTIEPGQLLSVTLTGTNWFNETAWNMKRQIVVLDEKVTIDENGFDIDFATADEISPVTVINFGNAPESGWNLNKPYLEVGYNPQYDNYVDTDALLLVDLISRDTAQLSFTMEFDTEQDYDFVEVFVTQGDSKELLFRESGVQASETFTFDINSFAGKDDVIVHFRFVTDTNTTAQGVRLSGFSIK
ncbi:MAG: S41 family peptidase [Spirochaetes bacterium]|nr:S41 family peptidase [Spirochaetota bacterium]